MKVYYSHLGEDELKGIEVGSEVYDFEGKIIDLIGKINNFHPGFKNLVLDNQSNLVSSTKIYKNVIIDEDRIFDGNETFSIKDVNGIVSNSDNLLISIYNPRKLGKLFEETIKEPSLKTEYIDVKRLEPLPLDYKVSLDDIKGPIEEKIKTFENGICTLKDIIVPNGEPVDIKVNSNDFDRKGSNVIQEPLAEAIQRIWGLNDLENKLYLHQEDCLFYILGKLKKPDHIPGESLLLAIPTGGGKTEAFLIPVISHIFDKKSSVIQEGLKPPKKIQSIITYPTKALANDQTNRIVEILFELNKNTNPEQKVSVGILTGDTPNGLHELKRNSIIQICPNCNNTNLDFIHSDLGEGKKNYIRCKNCGNELDFITLTREDIMNFPPDILITNLDMINHCLQSPFLRTLFRPENLDLDLMVFDEVHLCESVFGCHTGHLLRRLESTCEKKPLYIGVSATIGNAVELASLVFNVHKKNILFLNEDNRPYLKEEVDHYKYHYVLTPHKWKEPDRYAQVVTTALNTVEVLCHAIKDPHFRKTIVFSNYRIDTDNLVKYLRDHEDRHFKIYRDIIKDRLTFKEPLEYPQKRIAESIGGWYDYLNDLGCLYNNLLEVGWHRGGLEQKERLRAVTRFSTSKFINQDFDLPVDIMMATNTLELGIDIGDVTNVFNCSSPFTVNEYVQRSGRGGRKNDSSTFTIIDPMNPLDFYLKKHFEDYVIPEKREFEDAPIIITNESVTTSHIYARILDYISDELIDKSNYKMHIEVKDLRDFKINYLGESIEFMKEPEKIGEIIFEKSFEEKGILNLHNEVDRAIDQYNGWFDLESEILNIKKAKIDEKSIKELIVNKCRILRDKIKSEEISTHDKLNGMHPVDNTLVPKMRGSGPVCNVKLIRETTDEIKDYVARRRAITNMPPGGFATQGANTFIVESLDRDPETEIKIRNILIEEDKAFEFFKENFEDFPNKVPNLDLRTPMDIKVRYYPYRFYCPKCGKTYTSVGDNTCNDCYTELRQLTEIYVCENPECGEIYEPPVPRVCINPNHLQKDKNFLRSINPPARGMKPKPKYDKFHFNALPELDWECLECGAIFNFNQKWRLNLPKSFVNKPFKDLDFTNPEDIAKYYQYRPEALASRENYFKRGYNPARYSCVKCNKSQIKAKNVPTVRSKILEYILNKNMLMESKNMLIGKLEFNYVDIISMSREYSRKIFTKDTMEIKDNDIFPGNLNSFLANTYSTHAAYLSLHAGLIDEFIGTQTDCLEKDCADCDLIQNVQDSEMTKPNLDLKQWERNKTPDVRSKWCETLRNKGCDNDYCFSCSNFVRRDYLKYLLIHALKHALILSMPKYMGVKKNEIRGLVYPNGKEKPELVFLDVHEDGSGSIYLMRRNWKNIWELSEELMKNANEGKGSLLLPQFCERHNVDLCPVLGLNFYEFVRNLEEK